MTERNWAGNVAYGAARWHEPSTVAEVQAIVAHGTRVRAVGSRHSFSTIADTDGDAVSMRRMDRIVALDATARTVTVEGGVRYGELATYLHVNGWALANLASLPHISVAGAVATGTHGSGASNGNLATAVDALELVTAMGDVVQVTRSDGDGLLDALVVGLGAFGIVTRLTLRIEPTFQVAQRVYEHLPFATADHELPAIMAAGYSVSLFSAWRGRDIDHVWCKRRLDPAGDPAGDDGTFFGAAPASGPVHPIAALDAGPCTEQLGRPGPWHERLPHFRLGFNPSSGQELQSELFVAEHDGPAALRVLAGMADELAAVLMVSEVRAVAADDLWLSPCYGRQSIALHFTWVPRWPDVRPVLAALERALAPFEPRPHWGKLTTLPAAAVRSRHPRLADAEALRARWDPNGRFRNAYLDDLLA